MNYLQKILIQNDILVIYLSAKDDNDICIYYYLAVKAEDINKLRLNIKAKNFNPKDYGDILYSGYGEPTYQVKQYMYNKYGCKYEDNIELIY